MERAKHRLTQKLKNEAITARKIKIKEDHEKKLLVLTKFSISNKWTEKEEKAAFKKLSKVAFLYDKKKDITLQVNRLS